MGWDITVAVSNRAHVSFTFQTNNSLYVLQFDLLKCNNQILLFNFFSKRIQLRQLFMMHDIWSISASGRITCLKSVAVYFGETELWQAQNGKSSHQELFFKISSACLFKTGPASSSIFSRRRFWSKKTGAGFPRLYTSPRTFELSLCSNRWDNGG